MLDLISVNMAMCVVDMVSIGLVGWRLIREPLCTRKVIYQVGLLPVLVIHCNYGFPMSNFTEHCTSKAAVVLCDFYDLRKKNPLVYDMTTTLAS